MLPAQSNRSILDAVLCLQALARSREPMGASELARHLHLEPTRAHRILKTLAHTGLLRQDHQRRFLSGPGLYVLAAQGLSLSPLWQRALLPLRELRALLSRPVMIGVFWEGKVAGLTYSSEHGVVVDQIPGMMNFREATQSAVGMALLSRLDDGEIERIYFGHPIPGYPGGIPQLLNDLRTIRSLGYAYLPELDHPDADLLAYPHEEGTAAIGVLGPMGEDDVPDLLVMLQQAAEKIEKNPRPVGYAV